MLPLDLRRKVCNSSLPTLFTGVENRILCAETPEATSSTGSSIVNTWLANVWSESVTLVPTEVVPSAAISRRASISTVTLLGSDAPTKSS
jgi:hypothetical protein